mgnify:CR=1 FL=1
MESAGRLFSMPAIVRLVEITRPASPLFDGTLEAMALPVIVGFIETNATRSASIRRDARGDGAASHCGVR